MRRLRHAIQVLLYPLLSAAVLTACGNDVSGPPQPAFVVLTNAFFDSYVDEQDLKEFLELHLRNEGGPGFYRIEVWGDSSYPDKVVLLERTEPLEVTEDYADSVHYEWTNVGLDSLYVLVFSRDQSSAEYRQTDSLGPSFPPTPPYPPQGSAALGPEVRGILAMVVSPLTQLGP